MHEITRRDLLKRTGGAVPLLAVWQVTLDANEALAQPEDSLQFKTFAKLSAVLTGAEDVSQLEAILLPEYFARIRKYMGLLDERYNTRRFENLFGALLAQFAGVGTPDGPITPAQRNLVASLMGDRKCHYTPATFPPPCPPVNKLIGEAHTLIDNWETKDFGCEPPVPKIISVQPVCAADYASAKDKCVLAFICQDIVCLWFMSAIYRDSEFVVPAQTFHYGSVLGYVSGLVWPTVGGGTHSYAQCGGEFGYWKKDPEPDNG